MRRLLTADLRRLIRSPLCVGAVLLMMIASAGFVFMQTLSAREVGLERVLLLFMSVYGVVAALVIGLLHGGEYSEGTLRNKLICGYDRVQVYGSQAIVSVIICVVMYLVALLTALVLGTPLFDLHVSPTHEALTAVIGLLCCVYYASLYTMVTALCGARAAAVAANMSLSVGMLMLAITISEMLIGPSAKGGVWRVLLEAMPTGQAVLVNEAAIDAPLRMVMLNILGAAACMGVGAMTLWRRDVC